MGCLFSTEHPDIVESKSKNSDVPRWATTEWENLLHANDLSMDQENLNLAKERFYDKERILEHNQDMFEELKRSGEVQMLERKKEIEEEHMALRKESSRVKMKEINLKKKEDKFEKMRKKEEGQMVERRRSLASEQSLLWEECGKVMLREMDIKNKEEEFAEMRRNREEQTSERKGNLLPEGEEIHQKINLLSAHQRVQDMKEEDEFERYNGEDVVPKTNSVLLHQEKHEHQIKEMALTLLMEKELLKKEKRILSDQQREIQHRESNMKKKEEEIQSRETNLLLVILEMKKGSLMQPNCGDEAEAKNKQSETKL